jgi:hypothetical protein
MKTSKLIILSGLLITISVHANPTSAAPSLIPSAAPFAWPSTGVSPVEAVQYRRGSRSFRRGGGGSGIALGLGAAIIGGIILSEAARADHQRSNSGDWERCAQSYRSFEPNTGMYTGYDGVRHTCPYLR